MPSPAVAKDIDAFCSRCKLLLNHVIIAKVGTTVKRVKCLTCGNEHVYRAPVSIAARPKRKSAAARGKVKASDYDTLMRGRDITRAKPYKPAEKFAKGEVVNHAQFGVGLVVALKEGSKIEVAFADGAKTLVHTAA